MPVLITGRLNLEKERRTPFKDIIRRRPTSKELQEKKYLFPVLDFPGMLDDFLKKGVIQFPTLQFWESRACRPVGVWVVEP